MNYTSTERKEHVLDVFGVSGCIWPLDSWIFQLKLWRQLVAGERDLNVISMEMVVIDVYSIYLYYRSAYSRDWKIYPWENCVEGEKQWSNDETKDS